MAEKKITQREYFEMIIDKLETIPHTEDLIDFCKDRIEKLSKKSSGEKKVNAENEKIKDTILSILENTNCEHTISDLMKYVDFKEYTPQKISSLMTQLKNAGKVQRIESSGKAYFRIPRAE